MKIKPQPSNSSSLMARLLSSHKTSFVVLRKGESVKGKIIKLTPSEILVDLGAKTSALVLEKDRDILHTLLSVFKEGDEVEVLVLSPESENGQPIVSLRRYLGKIAWKKLEELMESREVIKVKVSEVARGGYVVNSAFGATGFLPQSHISFSGNQSVTAGVTLSVTVLELNRNDNKIIFSQKPTFSDEEFKKLSAKFKPEQKVKVQIVNVANFGLFVTLPVPDSNMPLEGFIHISEIAWDKTAELGHLFTSGQEIEAVILKFDNEAKKVQLSIKRLSKDPFEEIMANFPVDKKVKGSVTKIEDGGVVLELGENVEGFIRKEKIPPTVNYKVGQELSVLVSEYDKRRKRIYVLPVLLTKQIGYR